MTGPASVIGIVLLSSALLLLPAPLLALTSGV